MAAQRPEDEGMDILKFFIAIMGFLTVLVGGMAIYNWSTATSFEEEIAGETEKLEKMRNIGEKKDLRELIAEERANKDLVDVLRKDLGEFLQQTATQMQVNFSGFDRRGSEGAKAQGYDKVMYQVVLDKIMLANLTEFLFYIQNAWPGLKIEEIIVKESSRKKDEPHQGWNCTVKISIFRPKQA
jgi:hypothetical protein